MICMKVAKQFSGTLDKEEIGDISTTDSRPFLLVKLHRSELAFLKKKHWLTKDFQKIVNMVKCLIATIAKPRVGS